MVCVNEPYVGIDIWEAILNPPPPPRHRKINPASHTWMRGFARGDKNTEFRRDCQVLIFGGLGGIGGIANFLTTTTFKLFKNRKTEINLDLIIRIQ